MKRIFNNHIYDRQRPSSLKYPYNWKYRDELLSGHKANIYFIIDDVF